MELWDRIVEIVTGAQSVAIFRAVVVLLLGIALARFAGSGIFRLLASRVSAQHQMLARRLVFYGVLGLTLAAVLHQLGFDLTVLLGAAGILTVALGFASQTAASNLISGLFLIGERPFVVGDVVKIGETIGEVVSIDLVSVRLRTFDNLQVRVPNESLFKSQITTFTAYPIRRYDLPVGVAYREDLGRVREVLLRVADDNPLCLDEPAPLILFLGYGDSSVDFQFSVWSARPNYLEFRNTIGPAVKAAFDAEGIEIPFPHRTLYTGSRTEPFPVRTDADPVE